MSSKFYPKFALSNIKKNARLYVPYFIAIVFTVAMFYIMTALKVGHALDKVYGSMYLQTVMGMGTIVIGLFAAVFLFYANSFLMKRRKKEFGLYNILGMEKRHIAKIMFFEMVFVGLTGLILGVGSGILFSKLMTMLLYKIIRFSDAVALSVPPAALVITAVLFAAIFVVILISNTLKIRLSTPAELLSGGNVGEKEPKTKIVLAIIGVICLGIGYTIAIVTESPLNALSLFFLAVILVIVGTYCLFTAGSIAILKYLKKKKNYYYKPKHFTAVSGMLYRMKQNAVGLANICILSTMVLVLISTTVCLYIGTEDALNTRYPTDVRFNLYNITQDKEDDVLNALQETAEKHGRTIRDWTRSRSLSFAAKREGNVFITDTSNQSYADSAVSLVFITAQDLEKVSGNRVILADNEVLVSSKGSALNGYMELFGKRFTVKKDTDGFIERNGIYSSYMTDVHYIVVKDEAVFQNIYQLQNKDYGKNASRIVTEMSFNMDGTKEEIAQYYLAAEKAISFCGVNYYGECRQTVGDEIYSLYGGLLFLGIFLGALFMVITVLIIYYKQISEGYEDKERFEIMTKVGMSRNEVKKTIDSQILTVFFLPLAVAVIHILAAFKMITRLFVTLNLTNVVLFAWCTAGTVIVFAVFYAVIYALTARTYYRIVR